MLVDLLNQVVFVGLLLFGFYIVSQNIRTFLFPQKVGTIVSIGEKLDNSDEKMYQCKNCDLMPTEPGRSTISLGIRLDTGEICKAEISPCCICIDRMKVGDCVGVTRIGSRVMAQKISKHLHNGGV